MKKFMDFSDQVTFVSSSIVGSDFDDSLNYYGWTFKSKEALDKAKTKVKEWQKDKSIKDLKAKIKSEFDNDISGEAPSKGNKPQQPSGKPEPSFTGSWKDLREADEVLKYAESEEGWGKDSPEAELAKKQREATFDKMRTGTETSILENEISNLKLSQEKSRLQRQKDIKDAGGRLSYGFGNVLEKISNTEAAKKAGLKGFRNTSTTSTVKDDKTGKEIKIVNPRDSVFGYLADEGDKVSKVAGEVVTTAAKTAGNTFMNITGYKGDSDKTASLKKKVSKSKENDLKSAKESVKNTKSKLSEYKQTGGLMEVYYGKKLDKQKDKLKSFKGETPEYSRKTLKLMQKAKEAESQDKFDHLRKVTGTVGAGVTVAKTAVSSKARENVIRQEGIEGLQRKQATLAYLLGDRSRETKIAAGKTKGLNLYDRFKARGFERKLKKNQEQYMKSLQAPQYNGVVYNPQTMTPQQYRRAAGFSEEQISSLNTILNTDFSEVSEAFEGLNLSWQPEEYEKLNQILETDFETLDQEVAQNSDMSEKDIAKETDLEPSDDSNAVAQAQTDGSVDNEEIDLTKRELGENYPNPEVVEDLLETSFYQVPEEEKQYQEMIAKGFAEASDDYTNFLESMSEFSDLAY